MLRARVGLALMAMSLILWLGLPLAPLVSGSAGVRAMIAAGSVLAAEVAFWVGMALAGSAAWAAVKKEGWLRAFPTLCRLAFSREPGSAVPAPARRPDQPRADQEDGVDPSTPGEAPPDPDR